MGCPPVRKIIHSLKLADYLHVHADNPWYNYYLAIIVKEYVQPPSKDERVVWAAGRKIILVY